MKRISLALAGFLLLSACGSPTDPGEKATTPTLRLNSGVNELGSGATPASDSGAGTVNTTTAGDSVNVTGRGVNGMGSG